MVMGLKKRLGLGIGLPKFVGSDTLTKGGPVPPAGRIFIVRDGAYLVRNGAYLTAKVSA
jgi:hypothetical protein